MRESLCVGRVGERGPTSVYGPAADRGVYSAAFWWPYDEDVISRPAISEKRLSLTPNGNVHYQLKTPSRDGTTHVILEPLHFIARLAALVPKPRLKLTRFHGVLAPNSKHRVSAHSDSLNVRFKAIEMPA